RQCGFSEEGCGGRKLIGMPAGFISEWWPASNRNGGRLHVGIPGRNKSESAGIRRWHRLALEIKTARWPSKDPAGSPSAHSQDESRQPIMGRTTDSWRASQARHRCRTNHRCKVYGEGKATAFPSFIITPTASRRWTCSWFRQSHSDCSMGCCYCITIAAKSCGWEGPRTQRLGGFPPNSPG